MRSLLNSAVVLCLTPMIKGELTCKLFPKIFGGSLGDTRS